MENIAVAVADNIVNKELLHDIITAIIYDDDYDEILKLKIFDALNEANKDIGEIFLKIMFFGIYTKIKLYPPSSIPQDIYSYHLCRTNSWFQKESVLNLYSQCAHRISLRRAHQNREHP
ncbi:hypothetical protein SAMN05421846_11544 [Chryseobacterium taeanense]|uniref:Uncharacterized protein n=1 Tax=Chryseobacterium taeanense TaxID=311334 RepID=A0A1G8NXA4_9FLAO|nr:hypothetical protein SAMN05421846_11544 [Chryseobacterium taeanense]